MVKRKRTGRGAGNGGKGAGGGRGGGVGRTAGTITARTDSRPGHSRHSNYHRFQTAQLSLWARKAEWS